MKPLLVLIIVFGLSLLGTRFFGGSWNIRLSGTIAMAAMLLFTSIGHFAFTTGMAMMMPSFIPFKKQLVWLTGAWEVMAAIGLLLPAWRHNTSIFLLVFFILLLPANIYAAIKKVDYEKGTYEGKGPGYLWFRVPLQALFVIWVYLCDHA